MKLTSGALTMMITKYRAVLKKMFANNNLTLRKSIAAMAAGVIMTSVTPAAAATYTVGPGGDYATLFELYMNHVISHTTFKDGDILIINGDDNTLPFALNDFDDSNPYSINNTTITGNGTVKSNDVSGMTNTGRTRLINNIAAGKTVYIYNENGKDFIVANMSNYLENSPHGGAIYSDGSGSKVLVGKAGQDGWTIFQNNKATTGSGGAIYLDRNANTTLELAGNVKFMNNTAPGFGGAVIATSVQCLDPDANIEFNGNKATGSTGNGGAIYTGTGGSSTLKGNYTFNNNSSIVSGGAILVGSNATMNLDGKFNFSSNYTSSNSTSYHGGAISVSSGSTLNLKGDFDFYWNLSNRGGAIYLSNATTANFDKSGNYSFNYSDIYLESNATANFNGNFLFEHSDIRLNANSKANFDGDFVFKDFARDSISGTIYLNNSAATLNGTYKFINNKIYAPGGAGGNGGSGGAIAIWESSAALKGDYEFTGNTTAFGHGGAIDIGGYGKTITFDGKFLFDGNSAGGTTGNTNAGRGGAIYTDGTVTLNFDENGKYVFKNNTAARTGGAIYLGTDSIANLNGTFEFTGNKANSSGGAIYLDKYATTNFNGNFLFKENYGSAIYSNAKLTLNGYAEFIKNTGLNLGGAVYSSDEFALGNGAEVFFSGNSTVDPATGKIANEYAYASAVRVKDFTMATGSILRGEGGFAAANFSLQNATIAPENGDITLTRIDEYGSAVRPLAVTDFNDMTVQGKNGNLFVTGGLDVYNNLTVSRAKLNVSDDYRQRSGAHLILTANTDGSAIINVGGNATLTGTYEVNGIGDGAATASSISSKEYTLIHADGVITDNGFSSNTGSLDYILLSGALANNNKDYNVKTSLAWNDASGKATGNFTIGDNKSFEVDVALVNNTNPNTTGWDGKSLTKKGNGELILSNTLNTYSGKTTVEAGALTLKAQNAIQASSDVILNGGKIALSGASSSQTFNNLAGAGGTAIELGDNSLTVNSNSNTVFGGVISNYTNSAGSFVKTGAGSLTLTGANTYTVSTNVNEGSLILGAADTIKNSREVIVNGGGIVLGNNQLLNNLSGAGGSINLGSYTLTANNNAHTTFGGVIGGAGGLTKTGAQTLTLSDVNTYTGATNINGGTLALQAADAIKTSGEVIVGSGSNLVLGNDQTLNKLSGGGNINLTDKNLTANNNNYSTTAFGGVISGTGSLVKDGTGILTLTGDNTYTGGTVINNGGLQIGDGTSGSVAGNIENNASLSFINNADSVYAGVLSGNGGAMLKGGTGKLTLTGAGSQQYGVTVDKGTLAIGAAGTAINFRTTASYGTNAGATTQIGAGSKLDIGRNFYQYANSHLILTANADRSAVITVGGDAELAGTYEINGIGGGNVSTKASQLGNNSYVLIETTGGTITDNGFTNSGDFAPTGLDYLLQTGGVNAAKDKYEVKFALAWNDVNGKATGDFTLDAGNLFEVDVALANNNSPGSGWDGKSLTKKGAGELILSNVNTYTGATTVNAGSLKLGAANAIAASGEIIVNSGGRIVFDNSDQTLKNLSGNGNIDLGNNKLTADNTGDTAFGGVIGGAGSLVKTGANALTLSGANTYTGATTVNAGSLKLGAANAITASGEVIVNGGQIIFEGYDQTFNNLSGVGGSINLGNNLLTVNNNSNFNTIFSGVIGGAGGVTKTGTDTLTLSGANTYTGATSVNGGILALQAADAIKTSGEVIVNSGSQIVFGGDQTLNNLSGGGNIDSGGKKITANNTKDTALGGKIDGNGDFIKTGAGALTLTGDSYNTGETTVADGKLAIGVTGTAVDFNTTGGYTTQRGSTTQIGAGSNLDVGGDFTQEQNSHLILTANADRSAIITVDGNVNLAGSYEITGIGGGAAAKASELGNNSYVLIETKNGGTITDNSFTNTGGIGPTGLDYLLQTGAVNANKYEIAFSLGWNAADATATGNFTVAQGTSFDVDVSLANNTSHTGNWDGKSLTKNGAGELILSAFNTYTGATTVNDGTLTLKTTNDAIAASSEVIVNSGGKMVLDSSNQTLNNLSGGGDIALGGNKLTANNTKNTAFGGVIGGAGSLVKTDSGKLTLTGANTYTGTTTVSGGTLQIGDGTTGSVAGDITNNAALIFNNNHDSSYDGLLSGSGALTKAGTGKLTLTETNSQQGSVTVASGTLGIGAAGTAIKFDTSGGYTTKTGATTQIGAGSELNVGGFTQEAGANLILAANNNKQAVINATGNVSLAGTYEVTGISGNVPAKVSGFAASNYVLIETTGTITDNGFTNTGGITSTGLDYLLHTGGVSDDNKKYEVKFSLAWNDLKGNATGDFTVAQGTLFEIDAGFGLSDKNANTAKGWDGKSLTKNGAGNLILSDRNTYTGATTVNGGTLTLKATDAIATSSEVIVNSGSQVVFDNSGQTLRNLSGDGNIDLKTNELTANNAKDTTFGGVIDGAGSLVKTGTNALTLSGVNTYTGSTTVNAGALKLGAENAIAASGAVVVNAGGQVVLGGYNQTLNNLAGGGSINLGNNVLTVNNETQSDNTEFSGAINDTGNLLRAGAGNVGSLVKAGAGTLTLSGVNTYTGATTVSGGTLALQAANAIATSGEVIVNSGGRIVFDGSNQTLNNLSGVGGAIDLDGNELTANNTKDTTFSGVIDGAGAFVKTGDATLTLTGTTYDVGTTSVENGTLKIGDTGTNVNFNTTGDFNIQTNATAEIGAGSTLTVQDGNFTQAQDAGLILTAGSQGPVINIINGSATLSGEYGVNGTDAVTASALGQQEYTLIHATGGITGTNSVSSVLDYILLSSNFSDGDTDYKVTTSLAWNAANENANGNFTVARGTSFDVDVALANNNSHTGGWDGKSLTKDGEGELILSKVNTYTGATNVNAGLLKLGAENAIAASGEVIVNSGGRIVFDGSDQTLNNLSGSNSGSGDINLGDKKLTANNTKDTAFGGTITGTGSLVKTGDGVLTLSGASGYTGDTTINAGGIIATNGEALGFGNLAINNTAILEFSIDEDGMENFGGDISGSKNSSLIKNGDGQLTLSGTAINHLGTTRIDAGALLIASNGANFGNVENTSILSFDRNYSSVNGGTSLTIGRYSGDGLVNLNAYVDQNYSWTDFLTFTETPDNVVNLGFNFITGTNLSYLSETGLHFATIENGEPVTNIEGGDAAKDENIFKLQTVSPTGLIGASELFISTEDNSSYYLQKKTNLSAIKAYSEALGASASQLAAMFDTPLFSGLKQAGAAAKGGGTGVYFAGGRTDYRHKTGSHADVKGNTFALALAWEKEKTTYGIFGQVFNGNYKTAHNGQTQAGAVTINSNGSLKSHDVGLFATYTPGREVTSDGARTGAYYTTVLKTGHSKNRFDGGSDLGGSTFESGKGTFGYSLGGGYVKELSPGRTVDYYGHIVYSRLNSDELTDSVGQRIKMDSVNSVRLLSGVQWTLNADKPVSTIIRTGLDYEFKGSSVAYINGVRAESANLKGLTGVIELGFSSKRSKNLSIDGMIHGFVGKKSGLAGSLMLSSKF